MTIMRVTAVIAIVMSIMIVLTIIRVARIVLIINISSPLSFSFLICFMIPYIKLISFEGHNFSPLSWSLLWCPIQSRKGFKSSCSCCVCQGGTQVAEGFGIAGAWCISRRSAALKRWLITHTTKIGMLTTVHGHYSCGGVILASVMELQTGRCLMTPSGHFRGSPCWTSMDKL